LPDSGGVEKEEVWKDIIGNTKILAELAPLISIIHHLGGGIQCQKSFTKWLKGGALTIRCALAGKKALATVVSLQ